MALSAACFDVDAPLACAAGAGGPVHTQSSPPPSPATAVSFCPTSSAPARLRQGTARHSPAQCACAAQRHVA